MQYLVISPEKFFGLGDGMIDARPMKGTRPRAADQSLDLAAALELEASARDRAENLMIVDLLRNDISAFARLAACRCPQSSGSSPTPQYGK
ncbi:MAG: chorismate-binding protein [Sphingomonadales bacterium]|nr:chorismate-binding protein [Sphingomonadales bacterium]